MYLYLAADRVSRRRDTLCAPLLFYIRINLSISNALAAKMFLNDFHPPISVFPVDLEAL